MVHPHPSFRLMKSQSLPAMKPISCIVLLTLSFSVWAAADLPKKAPYSKYVNLVQNSPFTSKPPPPGPVELSDPLEDYVLSGVSPIAGGYRVTLLNKKSPEERISISSDEVNPKHGFKILEVKRKSGDPLGTTVRLSSGSVTGTVAFDEKMLTLAAAPVARPQPNAQHPGAVPGAQPGMQPQHGQIPGRQPRPRVVPPPPAGGAPNISPFQPGGQQRSSGSQRFDRRNSGGSRR